LKRFRRAVKAFSMRFSRPAAFMAFLPRTRFNYAREVGDPTLSSVVTPALFWIARTFPEARFQVKRVLEDGQTETVLRHPMTMLLKRPNKYFSGVVMWMATIIDYYVSGNAYWIKVRDRQGRVVELWWVPSWMMRPKGAEDGSVFITHYEYRPPGSIGPHDLPVADVVHLRFGLDPKDMRLGLSPLASVIREIFTDEEAANFTASILRNMGVPGLIVSPENDEDEVGDTEADEIKQRIKAMTTGDARGEPLVMTTATKVQQFGFSPQQMNVRDLRRIPEERVSAVLGVPAVVAGLGAGLDRSTFTNMGEAREMAYESNIIPAQRVIAEELEHQLLAEFESDPEGFECCFDLTDVRVLQEDRMKQTQRVVATVNGGVAMLSEGRRALGLPVNESHEVFLRPANLVAIRDGEATPDGSREDTIAEATTRASDAAAALQELLVGATTTSGSTDQPE
jgi:HK97 family phage portal protein